MYDVHGLDSQNTVRFYEPEFYCLSNFSAFEIVMANGKKAPTAEHYYQSRKFEDPVIKNLILSAPSAHRAYEISKEYNSFKYPDWDKLKIQIMEEILFQKVFQHKYVLKKLIQTGDRLIVENSWRDPYWGEGPNKDGENVLGRLWMSIRKDILSNGFMDKFNFWVSWAEIKEWRNSKNAITDTTPQILTDFNPRNNELLTQLMKNATAIGFLNVQKILIDLKDSSPNEPTLTHQAIETMITILEQSLQEDLK